MIVTACLPEPVRDRITAYCLEKKPHEACGLLLGSVQNDTRIQVQQFVPIRNIAAQPLHRFEMDPVQFIPYVTGRAVSASIVGLLHSHPAAAAIPSQDDLQTPWRHLPSHWIVSCLTEPCTIRVYSYSAAASFHSIELQTK